jgi:hypothetical protein
MTTYGLSKAEWRLLRSLKSPAGIQRFLDERLAYDLEEDGPRCRSVTMTLEAGKAHCMSGALVGAAALRALGHPPLLVDLEAVRDDDHVLAVYRVDGFWGAVAKSNYSGLRSREPVYRSLRELVMSYFEHYYNLKGEKTLRRYSRPVNLSRFDHRGWMTSKEDVWFVPEYLVEIPHIPLLSNSHERRLARMDRRLFEAGRLGAAH